MSHENLQCLGGKAAGIWWISWWGEGVVRPGSRNHNHHNSGNHASQQKGVLAPTSEFFKSKKFQFQNIPEFQHLRICNPFSCLPKPLILLQRTEVLPSRSDQLRVIHSFHRPQDKSSGDPCPPVTLLITPFCIHGASIHAQTQLCTPGLLLCLKAVSIASKPHSVSTKH